MISDRRAAAQRRAGDHGSIADCDIVSDDTLVVLLPPRIVALSPATKFWPMVISPPAGELIVTPLPVWPIEPMVIGWPRSARIELLRPKCWATAPAGSLKTTAPVTRAGKL